jgi:hypothetical protein
MTRWVFTDDEQIENIIDDIKKTFSRTSTFFERVFFLYEG